MTETINKIEEKARLDECKRAEKKLKLFNIALVGGSISSSNKQYYAEDEKECKELFLENNPDLDDTDVWVPEVDKIKELKNG